MMKRGIRKDKSKLVALWIPHPLLVALDTAVENEDTDRSKFIRRALRNHILRAGIRLPEEAVA